MEGHLKNYAFSPFRFRFLMSPNLDPDFCDDDPYIISRFKLLEEKCCIVRRTGTDILTPRPRWIKSSPGLRRHWSLPRCRSTVYMEKVGELVSSEFE